jgi:hypothetical protein
MSTESNSVRLARIELELLEKQAEDPSDLEWQKMMTRDVLQVVQVISEQGHSGGSIGPFLNLVRKCALQENLTPLTGEDSEWSEVGPAMWQNKRYSAVFKDDEGKAYDIEGYIGVDPDGWTYTGGGKQTTCYIEFPYTKSRKYYPRPELIAKAPSFTMTFEESLCDTVEEVMEIYVNAGIPVRDKVLV